MIKAVSTFTTALSALVVACAMAAFFVSPAAAGNGVKCNGCVNSKDIKNLSVKLKDLDDEIADRIFLQRLDSDSVANGALVKAWAKIAADGTVIACDRCNPDSGKTRRVGAGLYHVDFTPVSTDISGRPYSGQIDVANGNAEVGQVGFTSLDADPSTVVVRTEDASGAASNKAFTVIVH